MKYFTALFLLFIPCICIAAAAENKAVLTITIGQEKIKLTAADLLAKQETREITIENDPAYQKPMHYRAIPFAALLKGMALPPDSVIEAVANDGFVAILPLDLVLYPHDGGSEAFLAIEPPDAKWPVMAGKKSSAGPFYIVWTHPEVSNIRSEQWPFMLASLRSADSPAKRWKKLAVDETLAADSPVRAGQTLFVTQCMSCHTMNGEGSSTAGPDLNLPASPTEYFRQEALKKYIRNPSSLRHWDGMQMHGFDEAALSDREIDLIIDYMGHMAARKE